MIVCITAQGPALKSRFEAHFARAPYFVFYDSRSGSIDAVRNGYIVNDTKIGQNVVKLLLSHQVTSVITGNAGDNAKRLLRSSGIALNLWQGEGTVREAIREMMPDALRKSRRQPGSKTAVKPAGGD